MNTILLETSRLIVVHRFLRGSQERNRFVFLVDRVRHSAPVIANNQALSSEQASILAMSLNDAETKCLDVRKIILVERHQNVRGVHRHGTAPTKGKLLGGECYVVYRFAIFIDGFTLHKGSGGKAEGVYLQPLCLAPAQRNDASSCRFLCIIPSGVSPEPVMRNIFLDILQGMTYEHRIIDSKGKPLRVFLDLVAIFGDTPGVNAFLDVRGHRGLAPCHRCNYEQRDTDPLNNPYDGWHGGWIRETSRRLVVRHSAVRLMNVPDDILQELGIVENPSPMRKVLTFWHDTVLENSERIPILSNGIPVVPSSFDPYLACIIAPDHLLTGHFRDVLNVTLIVLPKKEQREIFEAAILAYVRDVYGTTQNRIF